jgi:hypothetical protein
MRPGAEPIKHLDSLILYLHIDIWFVMVQIKIFPVIAIQLTPLQNQAVQVDPRLIKVKFNRKRFAKRFKVFF